MVVVAVTSVQLLEARNQLLLMVAVQVQDTVEIMVCWVALAEVGIGLMVLVAMQCLDTQPMLRV